MILLHPTEIPATALFKLVQRSQPSRGLNITYQVPESNLGGLFQVSVGSLFK